MTIKTTNNQQQKKTYLQQDLFNYIIDLAVGFKVHKKIWLDRAS